MSTKDCPLLMAYVTKLEGENAKLRESLEFTNSELVKESLELSNVRAENDKLRETVSILADEIKFLQSENTKFCELLTGIRAIA